MFTQRLNQGPTRVSRILLAAVICLLVASPMMLAQPGVEVYHTRGRLWETLRSDGMIGNPGAWDFLTSAPLGMFPAFENYTHPVGSENNAINTFANANFHNFRSGVILVARGLNIPGQPPSFRPTPADYEHFSVGTSGNRGAESEANRDPILHVTNFMEDAGFDPLLPEERTEAVFNTTVGVTVSRRTYAWSYPGYSDFIIYDYIFKNTGRIVSVLAAGEVPNPEEFQQQLNELYIAFHSATSVSTKSQINFYADLLCVQAGAFGWQPPYHDFYHVDDDGTLLYSTNYNGGKEPPPFYDCPRKDNELWKQKFGPELHSPAAFGWLMLHADPGKAGPRANPAPDILRIDNHKGNLVPPPDLEFFKPNEKSSKEYFDWITTGTLQEGLGNNGDRMNLFTKTFGPFALAPGDSVRIVLAEIAGVMDYHEVIKGDPEGHFPDSTIAAIRRNAVLARNAVAWGMGATVGGIPLAADAPEPPPAPETDAVNASVGIEEAAIAVTWDLVAEETTFADGSGGTFYNGLNDLAGYRIYRSTDFQYTSDTEPPVLRGAAWTLLAEIPKAEFSTWFDSEIGRYKYVDKTVEFGRRYGYYVSAYRTPASSWTSANGTVVTNLPALESGSHRRTPPASALPGPVSSFDIYAAPNPFVFGNVDRSFGLSDPYRVEFRNLPERATLRIYTVSGDLIRTLKHGPDERGNVYGSISWDQKSDSGLLVAPGLYLFQVQSETQGLNEAFIGRLMIIR